VRWISINSYTVPLPLPLLAVLLWPPVIRLVDGHCEMRLMLRPFSPCLISEVTWPIVTKLCYMFDGDCSLYNCIRNLGYSSPQKIGGPKISQFWRNFGQLCNLFAHISILEQNIINLVSKISNLCGSDPPMSQTDRRTDRQTEGRADDMQSHKTALCTIVHRAIKTRKKYF